MKTPFFFLLVFATVFWCTSCGSKPSESALATSNDSSATAANADGDAAVRSVDDANAGPDAGNHSESETWSALYAGKLDGKIEVELQLFGKGEDVRGTITYKKSGKPIIVIGKKHPDGTFYLRELQPDGNITGVMSCTEVGKKLSGSWYAPNTDKELKLELEATAQQAGANWPYSPKRIDGEYHYHYGEEGPVGYLKVEARGDDEVTFEFNCITSAPGRNMAMIDPTEGTVVDGVLSYKFPDLDCAFEIRFYDGFAIVSYVNEQYQCEFGHNASIEGEFLKR
jgi:hypothetical protein